MNLSKHFTTARLIAAGRRVVAPCLLSVWMGASPSVSAQTDSAMTSICSEVFQLQPTTAQVHGVAGTSDQSNGQWWFEPNSRTQNSARTLSLSAADAERFLGAQNDSVLIRWHSTLNDAQRRAQRESYLVVRAGEPIQDMNGKTLGRFVRLIAKARWDERLLVEQTPTNNPSVQEFVAPLRIERAVEEVNAGDQVLPRSCVQVEPPQSVATDIDRAATTQARLLGLMNTHSARLIGAHSSIALMDQGAQHGVRAEQIWALVDVVAQNPSDSRVQVARQRATVRILQVLPEYSIVQINNAEREALRGATLKRLSKDTAEHEVNAP